MLFPLDRPVYNALDGGAAISDLLIPPDKIVRLMKTE